MLLAHTARANTTKGANIWNTKPEPNSDGLRRENQRLQIKQLSYFCCHRARSYDGLGAPQFSADLWRAGERRPFWSPLAPLAAGHQPSERASCFWRPAKEQNRRPGGPGTRGPSLPATWSHSPLLSQTPAATALAASRPVFPPLWSSRGFSHRVGQKALIDLHGTLSLLLHKSM